MKGYVFLLIIACVQGYNLEYPGCLDVLNAYKDSSTTTVSFNLNFIELTEFLHEERGEVVKEGALYHIFTGSRDEINALRDNMRRQYGTIAGILTIVMTILLVLRFKFKDAYERLEAIIDKYIGRLLNPCVVILALVLFVFLFLISTIITDLYNAMDISACQGAYIQDIIMSGKESRNWAGLDEVSSNLHFLHDEFIDTFKSMGGQFDYDTEMEMERIIHHEDFTTRLIKEFQNGFVNFQGNVANFQELLPTFFGSAPTTMNEVNSTLNNLIDLVRKNHELESSIRQLKYFNQSLDNFFPESMDKLDRNRVALQNSVEFSADYLVSIVNEQEWIIILSEFYLFVGFMVSIGYAITNFLIVKSKEDLFKKFATTLWIVILLEILFSLLMVYTFDITSYVCQGYCSLFDKMIYNETHYNLTMEARRKSDIDTYQLLYPCYYKNGDFLASESIKDQEYGMRKVIGGFNSYMHMMDQTHRDYRDAYKVFEVFKKAEDEVEDEQHSIHNNWEFMENKLSELKSLTLNQECYNHHWVFSIKNCGTSETILPPVNNNLLTYSLTTNSTCLNFNKYNTTGGLERTITYDQFLSNYVNDVHDNCTADLAQIKDIGLALLNANNAKYQTIEGLEIKLKDQEPLMVDLLKLQRVNYLTKKQQYEYLLTNDGAFPFNEERKKKWESIALDHYNCSALREQTIIFYESFCINFRAGMNKLYITTVVAFILLSALALIGFIAGFHQELMYSLVQGESDTGSDLNIDVNELNESKHKSKEPLSDSKAEKKTPVAADILSISSEND